MPELLLTVEQAAERLQLTPYTIRVQLRARRLRGIKRGRAWRVPESALQEAERPTAPELPTLPGTRAAGSALDDTARRLALLREFTRDGAKWTKGLPTLDDKAISRESIYEGRGE